jgi:alkylation response protein AidB-like acyl-CoA dehydrogenase
MAKVLDTSSRDAAEAPDGAELVRRARALVPALRARARQGDEDRRLPRETIDDLLDAGILQMMAPHRFGGSQADLATFFDVGAALAEGDGSTSWLFGILACHHWVLSHFPIEAQERLYGKRDHALFPLTFSGKGGTARRVEGGYVVNGHWSFASGIDFSAWVAALAKIEGGREDETVNLLMPIDEVEVVDNWFMSGMRGTGSRDFIVKDVFVPDVLSLPQDALMSGQTPGATVLTGYASLRTPLHVVLQLATAGAAFGLARHAIDAFVDFTMSRSGYGGIDHRARTSTQIRVAAAMARWDAFHDRVRAQFAEVDATISAGGKLPPEQRLRLRRDVALGAAECAAVVNDIVGAAGARAQHASSPFQRIQRDMNTVRTHVILDTDEAFELYGKHVLGMDLGRIRQ